MYMPLYVPTCICMDWLILASCFGGLIQVSFGAEPACLEGGSVSPGAELLLPPLLPTNN